MKTIKVELPDGRLISIEGADASQVAHILTNSDALTRNIPPVEEPLDLPTTGFKPEATKAQPGLSFNEEAPLALPVLNFEAPKKREPRPAFDGEEPLALPRLF